MRRTTALVLLTLTAIIGCPIGSRAASTDITTPEAAHILSKKTPAPPVLDGKLTDRCWKTAEVTTPYTLIGRPDPKVYGVWVNAEEIFVRNPTSARVCHDGKFIYVAIEARTPREFPAKSKITTHDGPVWGDDCVEVFLSPSRGAGYYQIVINSAGTIADIAHVAPKLDDNIAWDSGAAVKTVSDASGFTVEMRIPFASLAGAVHDAGSMWGINFTREGPSCGGLATWAPVGRTFSSTARFGYLVFESRAAYYAEAIKTIESSMKGVSGDVSSAVSALKQEAAKAGERREGWAAMQAAIHRAEDAVQQAALAGRDYIIREHDLWSDCTPDERIDPKTKDLSAIALFAGQNMRAQAGFAISNLSDKLLMGRFIPLSDRRAGTSEIPQKDLRFYKATYIEQDNGVMLPDLLMELPGANLIEIPAHTTVLVGLEADTTGLAAGKYNCRLRFLPSYSGFQPRDFDLDLEVAPMDMARPYVRQFAYISNYRRYASPVAARDLVAHGINSLVYVPAFADSYPKFDADGRIVSSDYSTLDKMIDTMLEAGVPKDEISVMVYTVSSVERFSSMPFGGKPQTKYGTDHWAKCLRSFAVSIRDHLSQSYGIDYGRLVFYTVDEPDGDPADPNSRTSKAIRTAQEIKAADPKLLTFTDPLSFDGTGKWIQSFIDSHDILEPCGSNTEAIPGYADKLAKCGREIWTYKVCGKGTPPATYRGLFWFQAKHDLALTCAFWCYDDHSGDSFNSYDARPTDASRTSDYGVVYHTNLALQGDERLDKTLPSRRWEAWYQGMLDARVITRCRNLLSQLTTKGVDVAAYRTTYRSAIDSADGKGMAEMDAAREKLIRLALEMEAR